MEPTKRSDLLVSIPEISEATVETAVIPNNLRGCLDLNAGLQVCTLTTVITDPSLLPLLKVLRLAYTIAHLLMAISHTYSFG